MPRAKGGADVHTTHAKEIHHRGRRIAMQHRTVADDAKRHSKHRIGSTGVTSTCQVIRSKVAHTGKQGLAGFSGISSPSVGARGICMHVQMIPPEGRAKAHLHANHETAIYVLSGAAEMWYGEGLRQHLTVCTGEFLYIPAGMPHLPANCSQTVSCLAVIARTDPNEQESMMLLPELDDHVHP